MYWPAVELISVRLANALVNVSILTLTVPTVRKSTQKHTWFEPSLTVMPENVKSVDALNACTFKHVVTV